MSSATEPRNWSFHAVSAAYAFSYLPHGYYLVKAMSAAKGHYTNMTPRTNLDALKSRVPAETWKKLACARGAHLNALEGFPLFAAAMIVGNMAQMPSRDLNTLAAEYLGARVLYNVLYMTAKSEAASYLRTGIYFWSVGIPFYGLWKAGNILL